MRNINTAVISINMEEHPSSAAIGLPTLSASTGPTPKLYSPPAAPVTHLQSTYTTGPTPGLPGPTTPAIPGIIPAPFGPAPSIPVAPGLYRPTTTSKRSNHCPPIPFNAIKR